jgi:DNA-binding LacI/PurR family transcriptional regulator
VISKESANIPTWNINQGDENPVNPPQGFFVGNPVLLISIHHSPGSSVAGPAMRHKGKYKRNAALRCYKVFMAKRKSNGPEPGQISSLKTLGEYLNLSPATISLVLNDAPGVKSIPEETRERVREAARKFDYRPSFFARSLRKGQTFSVGVLVPNLNDGYAAAVVEGVEDVLVEEGYFYFTASHRRRPDLLEEYPRLLLDRSVEGLIAIDTNFEHGLPVPTVAVAGHRSITGVTNVILDQMRAAELILEHLYKLGHRNIAHLRGGSHSSDADERWECLMSVSRDMGLPHGPELTVQIESRESAPVIGYAPTLELLKRRAATAAKDRFTAVVCFNDLCAIGAIRALREQNIRVPEDISVVGFDDIQSAAFQNPSLTTIRQPLRNMGATAARILLSRIRAQEGDPKLVPVQPELIVRESTTVAPRSEKAQHVASGSAASR